ncbi:hypothetical protein NQ317_010749 [Molorchus minor]|uniref:Mpv17-like protein 2 n=1 Tax=Molorchus minor TaxID=1323400 RepID=A0ABQ9JG73_9CUCU|nr:hypothetical protein NQ317_010749 [Molorchus minor]
MLIGDIIQQEIEYRQKKLLERYDYGRLSRMFLVGLGLGPLHHYFYVWLAKVMPDRTISTIMKKLLIDQFIMSPLCIAAFFLQYRGIRNETNEEMYRGIKREMHRSLRGLCSFLM